MPSAASTGASMRSRARLDELPSAEDASDLEARLGRVESESGETGDQLEELTGSVEDLETRVEDRSRRAPPDSAGGDDSSP